LIEGSASHRLVKGLYGFSVQSALGVSVERLARAGNFAHQQISVMTVDKLHANGFRHDVPSPGEGRVSWTVLTPTPLSLADFLVMV